MGQAVDVGGIQRFQNSGPKFRASMRAPWQCTIPFGLANGHLPAVVGPKTVSDDLIGDRVQDVDYVNFVHNVPTYLDLTRVILDEPISPREPRAPRQTLRDGRP